MDLTTAPLLRVKTFRAILSSSVMVAVNERTMTPKRIFIGRTREKSNDTAGENRQNRCSKNAKTPNTSKIAGEEKFMNETEDVKERQRLGEKIG